MFILGVGVYLEWEREISNINKNGQRNKGKGEKSHVMVYVHLKLLFMLLSGILGSLLSFFLDDMQCLEWPAAHIMLW